MPEPVEVRDGVRQPRQPLRLLGQVERGQDEALAVERAADDDEVVAELVD